MNPRVAALQTIPRWCQQQEALEERLLELGQQARQKGADLLVLPARLGWALLGPLLGLSLEAPYSFQALASVGSLAPHKDRIEHAAQQTIACYQKVAEKLSIWLVGGSLFRLREGDIYHATPVISATGEIQGWQEQTHLSKEEESLGLTPGQELRVFPTPAGHLGILLERDVCYPEVGRILALLGADVFVHQGAWRSNNMAEWMSRLWREVQANQTFGIESPLVGAGYQGQATIHCPCEMTSERRGVLAQARGEGEECLVAELDRAARHQVIAHYPILAMLNPEMYQRYFLSLYEQMEER